MWLVLILAMGYGLGVCVHSKYGMGNIFALLLADNQAEQMATLDIRVPPPPSAANDLPRVTVAKPAAPDAGNEESWYELRPGREKGSGTLELVSAQPSSNGDLVVVFELKGEPGDIYAFPFRQERSMVIDLLGSWKGMHVDIRRFRDSCADRLKIAPHEYFLRIKARAAKHGRELSVRAEFNKSKRLVRVVFTSTKQD